MVPLVVSRTNRMTTREKKEKDIQCTCSRDVDLFTRNEDCLEERTDLEETSIMLSDSQSIYYSHLFQCSLAASILSSSVCRWQRARDRSRRTNPRIRQRASSGIYRSTAKNRPHRGARSVRNLLSPSLIIYAEDLEHCQRVLAQIERC